MTSKTKIPVDLIKIEPQLEPDFSTDKRDEKLENYRVGIVRDFDVNKLGTKFDIRVIRKVPLRSSLDPNAALLIAQNVHDPRAVEIALIGGRANFTPALEALLPSDVVDKFWIAAGNGQHYFDAQPESNEEITRSLIEHFSLTKTVSRGIRERIGPFDAQFFGIGDAFQDVTRVPIQPDVEDPTSHQELVEVEGAALVRTKPISVRLSVHAAKYRDEVMVRPYSVRSDDRIDLTRGVLVADLDDMGTWQLELGNPDRFALSWLELDRIPFRSVQLAQFDIRKAILAPFGELRDRLDQELPYHHEVESHFNEKAIEIDHADLSIWRISHLRMCDRLLEGEIFHNVLDSFAELAYAQIPTASAAQEL